GHSFGLYARIWRALRALKPAIVHTRNLATLEAQLPSWFLPGVKTVHGEHGRDVFDLQGKNRKYNLLRRLIQPLVGSYIAVSRDLESWLDQTVGVGRGKIHQIYNGVDRVKFSPVTEKQRDLAPAGFIADDSIVIGTVGRLAAVKDQASLITAFGLLLHAATEYKERLRLIIVGDGPLRETLEQQIRTLDIQDNVWMAGDRDDVPALLRLLDLFVLPSLGEGISNTLLEAMATGVPVVATDVGGNPELVEEGHNGRLVPVNDPQALAGVMEQLVRQPDQLTTMGDNGLERVRSQFDWDVTVERYLSIYDELLELQTEAE
ncbi:MAG: glycosyltransferase, partial [Gammaproteobacteria bacterium]|nr:glycosyltransferase [Gammaproteobacteria bacterium]